MSADTSASDAVRPLLRVRQVREFTEEPVSVDALDAIADAARWSGSSTNSQPWRFVILRSTESLRAIAAAGMPQTRSLQSATGAVAVVLPEAKGKGISHAFDEGRAAERMLIAASFLDLGAAVAWILPDVRPVVGRLLQLPDDHFVRTIVAIGHPSAAARRPKSAKGKARLPREETVFYDRWGGAPPNS
ncbi:MAG: nitroreductase family protein [Candidatus Limnocylindria bacterium]